VGASFPASPMKVVNPARPEIGNALRRVYRFLRAHGLTVREARDATHAQGYSGLLEGDLQPFAEISSGRTVVELLAQTMPVTFTLGLMVSYAHHDGYGSGAGRRCGTTPRWTHGR